MNQQNRQLRKVTLSEKLNKINTYWDPHVVADYNGDDVMVVKFAGEFPFHQHPDTDDFFFVLDGQVIIDGEDGNLVVLNPGDLCVIPKGMNHRPRAEAEAQVLLIEPKGTPNTGESATASSKPRL